VIYRRGKKIGEKEMIKSITEEEMKKVESWHKRRQK
jgi:hypothetical protein